MEDHREFTSTIELADLLEKKLPGNEPYQVWLALVISSVQLGWLKISHKKLKAVELVSNLYFIKKNKK